MKVHLLPFVLIAAAFGLPCQAGGQFDATARAAVIDALASEMQRNYVFADTAQRVVGLLRARQRAGAYDKVTSGEQFAGMLDETLRAETKDGHIHLRFSPQVLPERTVQQARGLDEGQVAELTEHYRRNNYGIGKVDRLPGNIGYLSMKFFAPARYTGGAIASAMTLLSGTDALIVDLRENQGGDPEGVAQLESYFFNSATLMNTLYFRHNDSTRQFWTTSYLPGPRYGAGKPVYILTSGDTISAGEDMAYSMQARRRATIVGAVTAGAANPGASRRLHPHYSAFIPDGTAINPVTGKNWEGSGVSPDVRVEPKDALQQARRLALSALIEKEPDPRAAADLKALLDNSF